VTVSPPVLALAGAALTALLIADVGSETLCRFAWRHGFVDRPGVRKAHARPTPYLGGVAIAFGTLGSAAAVIPHWNRQLGALAGAGAVITLVGLLDDVRPTGPVIRLLAEAGAAGAVVAAGGRIEVFGDWLDPPVTVVWIVVLTNSFNLLDNMDGAAAMVAVATACSIAVAADLAGRAGLALLLMALAGGCLGFLVHNWTPARMFMGDSGSLFIGFVLAGSAVLVPGPGGSPSRLAELFSFTFVATVDTCLVVVARTRAGLSFMTAGTDHTSHRLHRVGLNVRQVASMLFAAAALPGLCGVLVVRAWLPGTGALVTAAAIAVAVLLFLLNVPMYGMPEKAPALAGESPGNAPLSGP
jgi:UDP-GlcNAc:undecaprenyl-phosphate GlcNAc-1-phosphate transferase